MTMGAPYGNYMDNHAKTTQNQALGKSFDFNKYRKDQNMMN